MTWKTLVMTAAILTVSVAMPVFGQNADPVGHVFTDDVPDTIDDSTFKVTPIPNQSESSGQFKVQSELQKRVERPLGDVNLNQDSIEPQPAPSNWNPVSQQIAPDLPPAVSVRIICPAIVIKNPLFDQPRQENLGEEPLRPVVTSGLKFFRDACLYPSRVLIHENRKCERINVVGQPEMCYQR